MNPNDIIGSRFGKLTVLEYAGVIYSGSEGHGRSCYRCICDCGNEVLVQRNRLLNGRRTSCGECFRIIQESGYYRYYDVNGASFIFDPCDLSLVKTYRWRIDAYGYPVTRIKGRNYRLSRLILKPGKNRLVDHINGDPADNRRVNMRLARNVDNQGNMRLSKHNKSGYKGVCFVKAKQRYKAQISINNKAKHIGYFDTPEEAARAYDTAARFLFGEFACVNFPLPGEQSCQRNQSNALNVTA